MRVRNSILLAALAIAIGTGLPALPAQAETVVRYGISMADIPLTTGQPDRGAGAYQFSAYTIYDPLVAWEMDVSDRPGKLVPGLATEWKVDDADKTKWRFKLRQGVKFHDGSDFNADAVVWNLDKVLNDKAPQFDKRRSAQVKTRLPSVASYAKIDDFTVEITTKTVDSFFPYQMLWFLVSSPTQYEKLGKDWDKFASQPSGTGPFKLTKLVPRELAELSKNADYWNKKRIPKVDKMILIPMPEALTRTNALLAGQVDLIETPAPDAVPQLKSAGMRIVDNITPHVWNYHLSVLPGSPWTDIRLRKALNLAIDRDAVVGLMNGLAKPAKGPVDPTEPWVRQADLRAQIRSRRGQEARRGSRLFEREAAEDDLHHRARRHRADAVAADERIPAAYHSGNRHRCRLQGGRTGNALHPLAQGCGGRDECRHHRQQHRLCDLGPALRHRPLLPFGPDRAGRRQLGRLQESESRRLDRRSQANLRYGETGRTVGAGAFADRRRCRAGVGGA